MDQLGGMVMLGNPLALVCGLLFCSMMILIFASSLKRSEFGWLIIFLEYFYVVGLGVFPLLSSLGAIDAPKLFVDYESKNGELAAATFVHIILYGLGALFGYFGALPFARQVSTGITLFSVKHQIDNYAWFYSVSGLSIVFSCLYFSSVGFETSITNASFTRSGDFSGLAGYEQYQFLKTLAMIGPFSMVFTPFIVLDGRRIKSTFLVITLFVIPVYLLTVARVIFFDTFVFFAMLLVILGRSKFSAGVFTVVIFSFMVLVLLFGKVFVGVLSVYLFGGGDLEFPVRPESLSAYFFAHFGHLVYSIDAGINNSFQNGPVLPEDVLLSPFGVIPSFVYSAVGLDSMSYQLVDQSQRFSCINTRYFFSEGECSVPPYFIGVSAYMLPIIGGFIFGFIRFLLYRVIENSWVRLRSHSELLWFSVFLLLIANQLMLFIPTTISFAVFISMALFLSLLIKKLLTRRKRPAIR